MDKFTTMHSMSALVCKYRMLGLAYSGSSLGEFYYNVADHWASRMRNINRRRYRDGQPFSS